MILREQESATKLRGGYYTEPDIASFLLRWVLQIQPKKLLEPSCGDGVFFQTLADLPFQSIESITAFEIEPFEAGKARNEIEALKIDNQFHNGDFLDWFLSHLLLPHFDAVVGNPPFIRYQYLNDIQQKQAEAIFKQFHLNFTKHTNAWVPFVIASLALLRPGGRLAMVVPSELLHILHAESLRSFIAQQCSKILIFDPQELWFEDTLQGAILLLAEKKTDLSTRSKGVAIIPTQTRAFLSADPCRYFEQAEFTNGEVLSGKWMHALLTPTERQVLKKAFAHPSVYRFEEVAEVAVGIVTGANDFFLVPNEITEQYELGKWTYPMFGRSEHVPGIVYDANVHRENARKGFPTSFVWFNGDRLVDLPELPQKYIKLGEKLELHKRYKCRIREPWYSVPSVYSTSIGMLKRSHEFPRLIFNKINAYTTDTSYRIQCKKFDDTTLVYSFINSLTFLTAELEGRHYGGGVLELVPSEIRKLAFPIKPANEEAVYQLDQRVQSIKDPEILLAQQDRIILHGMGFTEEECDILRSAWTRLRFRRQRKAT